MLKSKDVSKLLCLKFSLSIIKIFCFLPFSNSSLILDVIEKQRTCYQKE